MPGWRLLEYEDERGRRLFTDWYENQPADARAVFEPAWSFLSAKLDPADWLAFGDRFLECKKQHLGLHEIKFKCPKNLRIGRLADCQYRIAGHWRPHEREFVALRGCFKAGRQDYEPANAFDDALKLRRRLLAGKGATHERRF